MTLAANGDGLLERPLNKYLERSSESRRLSYLTFRPSSVISLS